MIKFLLPSKIFPCEQCIIVSEKGVVCVDINNNICLSTNSKYAKYVVEFENRQTALQFLYHNKDLGIDKYIIFNLASLINLGDVHKKESIGKKEAKYSIGLK